MLKFRWNEAARKFINVTLPNFPDVVHMVGERFVNELFTKEVLPMLRKEAPVYSGDMRDDFIFESLESSVFHHSVWWLGESGNLAIGSEDTHKHPAPFSYPLAKHDGAQGHRVWLYATDSAARKKLRRWVREHVQSALPETREEAEQLRADGMDIPMSIWVNPMGPDGEFRGWFMYSPTRAIEYFIVYRGNEVLKRVAADLKKHWR